jgi:acetylglutamate kinase
VVTDPLSRCSAVRHEAVAELLDAMSELLTVYGSIADGDRVRCWGADAERITGEVARALSAARTRLSSTIPAPVIGPD